MKICPECGKENRNKSFCTGCGHDIRDVETEEERIKREEQEQQLELERKEREQKEKQLEIERKEREQKEKQLELERKEREQKQKQFEIERKQRQVKEKKKRKQKSNLKIIGVLIIIIAVLCAGLYFVITSNNNQIIPDSNSDNAVEQLISFDDSPKLKTVDFNRLFRMDVNESSTFHEVSPGADWYVSKEWNNNINNTGYAFDGYNEVLYWKNTNLDEVVSNLSTIYHNPKYEGDIVILECYSKTSDPSYYDYLVGTQSNDNEVVLIMGSDLDLLKTYANSIVFE